MKVHIWYGPDGAILAVGSVQGGASFTPGSDAEDVKVLEVEAPGGVELARLHQTHRVSVSEGALVPG